MMSASEGLSVGSTGATDTGLRGIAGCERTVEVAAFGSGWDVGVGGGERVV